MANMRKLLIVAGVFILAAGWRANAQTDAGSLEFTAWVTPTAAKAEPARDFTFYLLTKSYDEIVAEQSEVVFEKGHELMQRFLR